MSDLTITKEKQTPEPKPDKYFLMSPIAQNRETQHYCFKCGDLCVGGLNFCGAPFLFCQQETCPHEEDTKPFGINYILDDPVDITVRKLKKVIL